MQPASALEATHDNLNRALRQLRLYLQDSTDGVRWWNVLLAVRDFKAQYVVHRRLLNEFTERYREVHWTIRPIFQATLTRNAAIQQLLSQLSRDLHLQVTTHESDDRQRGTVLQKIDVLNTYMLLDIQFQKSMVLTVLDTVAGHRAG